MSSSKFLMKKVENYQLIHPIPPSSISVFSDWHVNLIDQESMTLSPMKAFEQIVTIFGSREIQITNAKQFLRNQLSSVSRIEDILHKLEEIDRDPGFIIDFLILVSDSDRDTKRSIFSALGNLMRANPHLLFDFRIIKRKGRDREAIIPEGYQS